MEFLKKQLTFFPSEIHVTNITNSLTDIQCGMDTVEILNVTPTNATDEITITYNGDYAEYVHINKINNRSFKILIDSDYYFMKQPTGDTTITLTATANDIDYNLTYNIAI